MILLLALTAAPVQNALDWYALLQTRHTWECSADYILSGGSAPVLASGLPLSGIGSLPPDLPWPDASVTDPLRSGIWGGGRWNTFFTDGAVQDSLSISRIGLMQNTLDHSRYSFELDRPLPWGLSGNFEMVRDDSVSLQSALLTRGSMDFRLSSWKGGGHGWGAWTGWNSSFWYARAGFSRLYADDRRPELLGGLRGSTGPFEAEIGAVAAYVDSSTEYRGAGQLTLPAGEFTVIAAGDIAGDETGFWGGVVWNREDLSFSALHSRPGGEDSFQSVSIWNHWFRVTGRLSENPALAADIRGGRGVLRGAAAAGWFFDTDSLETNCHLLFGYDWYRGRLEAGPRLTASMDAAGEWNSSVDGVIGFTLLPFSIGAGLEDITDQYGRSWSFGITWAFTDNPPQVPEGEENGRESD